MSNVHIIIASLTLSAPFVNWIYFLRRDLSDFRRVCQPNWMTGTWQRMRCATHPCRTCRTCRTLYTWKMKQTSRRRSENLCCENWCTYIRWSVYLRELVQLHACSHQFQANTRRIKSQKAKWYRKFFGNRHRIRLQVYKHCGFAGRFCKRNELKW